MLIIRQWQKTTIIMLLSITPNSAIYSTIKLILRLQISKLQQFKGISWEYSITASANYIPSLSKTFRQTYQVKLSFRILKSLVIQQIKTAVHHKHPYPWKYMLIPCNMDSKKNFFKSAQQIKYNSLKCVHYVLLQKHTTVRLPIRKKIQISRNKSKIQANFLKTKWEI